MSRKGLLSIVASVTALIMLIRLLGWLQPFEWAVLDIFFQLRPLEKPDERIVIVGLQETDIQKYRWPVNDEYLATLLNKIKQQKPRVIGLDIFRDLPLPPGNEQLISIFKTTPNLIGIQNILGDESAQVNPSPILAERGQVAASDVIVDRDGVFRRYLLYPVAPDNPNLPSLGVKIAIDYLKTEGILPQSSADGWLKLRDTIFPRLDKNYGSYINTDAEGYQIFLNYRGAAKTFTIVSFQDVIEGQISADLFEDKIVLIGSTAMSIKDVFDTPYTRWLNDIPQQTYGVEIQANLISQIISSVLDNRPLIQVLPEPWEYLWIILWSVIPGILAVKLSFGQDVLRQSLIIVSSSLALVIILIVSTYFLFIQAWWLPIVPPVLGLFLSTAAVVGYLYINQLKQLLAKLEFKVELRTQELKNKNEELSKLLQELELKQQQIIAQEKLAYLGMLSAGIAHEIKNPVYLINNLAELSLEIIEEAKLEFTNDRDRINSSILDNFQENFDFLSDDINSIKEQANRIEQLIQSLLPQTRSQPSEPTWVELNKVVDNAWKLVYHSKTINRDMSNFQIVTNYDENLEDIKIIISDLTQALINIIDNAYEAVQEKYQKGIENYLPMITLATKNLGYLVEITVTDNGIGVPEKIKSTIFHPFVTNKPPGKGTGLGLSIAHDIIVGRHGGQIKLETEEGEYTRIVIHLPKGNTSK